MDNEDLDRHLTTPVEREGPARSFHVGSISIGVHKGWKIVSINKRFLSQQVIVFAVFLIMFLGFALFLPGFFNVGNLVGLLQNVAVLGILSLAMSVVVIGRGVDLSLVATLSVAAGLILEMAQHGYAASIAFVAGLGLTLVFGLVNGLVIAYAEVPSLFMTLASGIFLAGLGEVAFFQADVVQWSRALDGLAVFGHGAFFGVPTPIIMFALASLAVAFLLKVTSVGAYIYSIGDNPYAARVSGIPLRPIIVLQYVLSALIGGFGGLVLAASIDGMPTRIFNSTLIYEVILVVVLGGIGLSGGRGGVLNVIVGTLLIGTMLNAMTILDMSYTAQDLVKGVVLLIAILTDSIVNPRNEETTQQGDI